VLQFVDAWTNNFAYIGRRATGTAEAEYLLTDRGYDGPVPDGMTVVAAPTGVFTIVGPVQLNGEADLPAVHALQDHGLGHEVLRRPIRNSTMPKVDSDSVRTAGSAISPTQSMEALVCSAAKARSPR
jgi:hypothetical protein